MKKQILNIGKALNKAEQKQVNGGTPGEEEMCSAPSSYDLCTGGLLGNSCATPGEVCRPWNATQSRCICELS